MSKRWGKGGSVSAWRVVYRAGENKETEGSVRCVCLIAPVFAFPPLLLPVDACHHGLTGLFYRSPIAPPSSPHPLSPALFSLCLFISPWVFWDVCVSASASCVCAVFMSEKEERNSKEHKGMWAGDKICIVSWKTFHLQHESQLVSFRFGHIFGFRTAPCGWMWTRRHYLIKL